MADFRDHILYVVMAALVVGSTVALTVTGHVSGETAVGLLGASLPTGIGLGKNILAASDNAPSSQSGPSSDSRTI